ncbi:hypothetical protein BDV09DRAFT_204759 [Aspergillus tetrazonus]
MLVCCLPAFCLVASQDAMDAKNVVTYKAIKPRTSFTSSCSTTGEDSESLLERNQVLRRRHVWRELSLSNYIWAVHAIFFLFSLSFFLSVLQQRCPTEQQCAAQLSAYFRHVKVDPSDLAHLRKPPTQTKLRTTDGDWYTGGLEVFHQVLTCVNLIRQYTYFDYYSRLENRPLPFTDSNHTFRLHIGHCIDMLRQVVQCHGDVGIVTGSWVEGFPDPYPDFSTWHKCRKFQPLKDYTQEHLLKEEVVKTSEDLTIPKPPCESAGPHDICP